MTILPHVAESFDKIIDLSKQYAKNYAVKHLEQADKQIYSIIDKHPLGLKIASRTILTSTGIITF